MPVINNPFISQYGFESLGFSVSPTGQLIANSVTSSTFVTAVDISTTNLTVIGPTVLQDTLQVDSNSTLNQTIIVNDTAASESGAALTIIGGVGIQKNIIVGQQANIGAALTVGTNVTTFGSNLTYGNIQTNANLITSFIASVDDGSTVSNLEIEPLGDLIFKVQGQSTEIGRINATGINVPVQNTTINNTSIGATTPSTAAFVSATVTNAPTVASNITRKDYVDRTAIALAVAFGA